MKLFIDIETIPSQKPGAFEQFKANLKAPGNYTKQESIDKWIEENAEAEYRKQSFDGLYGEIISIAWAFENEIPSVVFRKNGDSEKELLEAFFSWIYGVLHLSPGKPETISQWIGHYITGFDLRFLFQRCVVNKVKPTVSIPYDAKPWDSKVFDTKIAWSGSTNYSGASSLDKLCKGMGIEGKGELDGSKVYDYWLAGRIDEIAEYNKQDVVLCREIYKRITFQEAA